MSTQQLFYALNREDFDEARRLLNSGVDVNVVLPDEGVAPLHLAAGLGIQAIKLLLKYAADPNIRSTEGFTPLHIAATWGEVENIRLLLHSGADPHAHDQDGFEPVDVAKTYDHTDCVYLLKYYSLLLGYTDDDDEQPKYTRESLDSLPSAESYLDVVNSCRDGVVCGVAIDNWSNNCVHSSLDSYTDVLQHRLYACVRHGRRVVMDVTSPHHPTIHTTHPPQCSLAAGGSYSRNRRPGLSRRKTLKLVDSGWRDVAEEPSGHVYQYRDAEGNMFGLNKAKSGSARPRVLTCSCDGENTYSLHVQEQSPHAACCNRRTGCPQRASQTCICQPVTFASGHECLEASHQCQCQISRSAYETTCFRSHSHKCRYCFSKSPYARDRGNKARTVKPTSGAGTHPSRHLLDTLKSETPEAKIDRWHSTGVFDLKPVHQIRPKNKMWFQPLVEHSPANLDWRKCTVEALPTSDIALKEYTAESLWEHADCSRKKTRKPVDSRLILPYSEISEQSSVDVITPSYRFADKKSSQDNDCSVSSLFDSSNSLFSESLNYSLNVERDTQAVEDNTRDDVFPSDSPRGSPVNDKKPPVYPGKSFAVNNDLEFFNSDNLISSQKKGTKASPDLGGSNRAVLHQFLSSRQRCYQQRCKASSNEKEHCVCRLDGVRTDLGTNVGCEEMQCAACRLTTSAGDQKQINTENHKPDSQGVPAGNNLNPQLADSMGKRSELGGNGCKKGNKGEAIENVAGVIDVDKYILVTHQQPATCSGSDDPSVSASLPVSSVDVKISQKSSFSDACKSKITDGRDHNTYNDVAESNANSKSFPSEYNDVRSRLPIKELNILTGSVPKSSLSDKSGDALCTRLYHKDIDRLKGSLLETESNQKSSSSGSIKDDTARSHVKERTSTAIFRINEQLCQVADLSRNGKSSPERAPGKDSVSGGQLTTGTNGPATEGSGDGTGRVSDVSVVSASSCDTFQTCEEDTDFTLVTHRNEHSADNTGASTVGELEVSIFLDRDWCPTNDMPDDDTLTKICASSTFDHSEHSQGRSQTHTWAPPNPGDLPSESDLMTSDESFTNGFIGNKLSNKEDYDLLVPRDEVPCSGHRTYQVKITDVEKTHGNDQSSCNKNGISALNTASSKSQATLDASLTTNRQKTPTQIRNFLFPKLTSENQTISNQKHTWQLPKHVDIEESDLMTSDESFVLRSKDIVKTHCENIGGLVNTFDKVTGQSSEANREEKAAGAVSRESVTRELSKNKLTGEDLKTGASRKNFTGSLSKDNVTKHVHEETSGKESLEHESVNRSRTTSRTKPFLSELNRRLSAITVSSPDVLDSGFCRRGSLDSVYSNLSCREYVYRDSDQGVVLIERHIPSECDASSAADRRSLDSSVLSVQTAADSDNTELYDWRAYQSDVTHSSVDGQETDDISTPSLPECLTQLSNDEVRNGLRSLGDDPGPVVPSTRQLYLVRLAALQAAPRAVLSLTVATPDYSAELRLALQGNLDLSDMDDLEVKMVTQFERPQGRKWREGTIKSSFNYLLLDPRVTRNLPLRARNLNDLETFRIFIAAIFYVGKGKRSRPYSHLYEAITHMQSPKVKTSCKVQHIVDIWHEGVGVVSLHCFQSTIPVEAYTREACVVEAFGLPKLTNMKKGDFYGAACSWSLKQKRKMGVFLLKKALQIFLSDGERQICPYDIKQG